MSNYAAVPLCMWHIKMKNAFRLHRVYTWWMLAFSLKHFELFYLEKRQSCIYTWIQSKSIQPRCPSFPSAFKCSMHNSVVLRSWRESQNFSRRNVSGHLCTFIQQSVNKDFTDVFKHSRLRNIWWRSVCIYAVHLTASWCSRGLSLD